MSCEAGRILGRHVPRKHGSRIATDIMWKGKRREVCEKCWIKISASSLEWVTE